MKAPFLLLLTALSFVACKKNGTPDTSPKTYDSTPSPLMQKTVIELDAYHKDSGWLQLPIHYNSGFDTKKYPLLIFYNGRYEGSKYGSLTLMKNVGVPKFMANSRFSFNVNGAEQELIVICPQSYNGTVSPIATNQIIDYMIKQYRVDVSRIYLTGVSSGASSIISYLTDNQNYANRIAAVVPMSIITVEAEKIANLKYLSNASVHTKIFCGNADTEFKENKSYVDIINRYRPGLAIFTSYVGGHGSWNNIYNPTHKYYSPNIYEWMLQYHN